MNDQIFPHVSTGFTDTVPALREQTIKVREMGVTVFMGERSVKDSWCVRDGISLLQFLSLMASLQL